ncbi:MAG: YfaP family protein [Bacteroidales bacterium]
MKKTLILLMIIVAAAGITIAQEDIEDKFKAMEDKFDDAFEEEDNQRMTLRFFDAVSGEPVENAQILFEDDELFTDYEGKVRFDIIEEDGNYPVKFSMEGYIPATYEFEVRAGTIFRNRFSVSPVLDIGSMRVVLDWDRRPRDLDVHFMNRGKYHISYHNTRVLQDGSGQLDRDDRNGFGPETITIKDVNENDVYACFVHDYSNRSRDNSPRMSKSGATLRVYQEDELIETIRIKETQRGNLWKVFTYSKGRLNILNEVTSR